MSPTDRLRLHILAGLQRLGARQADLAKHLGWTSAGISQVLTGKRGIRLDLLDQIAEFFGVSPAMLLEDPSTDPTRIDTFPVGRRPHVALVASRRVKAKLAKKLDPIARQQGLIEYQQDIAWFALAHLKPLVDALEALAGPKTDGGTGGRGTARDRPGAAKHRPARSAGSR